MRIAYFDCFAGAGGDMILGAMPEMKIEQIGYGAGASEHGIPNLLRLMIGRSSG